MMRISWPMRASLLLMMAHAPGAWAVDFEAGQWHVSVQTEIRGLGVRPPPAYYYDRCYTGKDILPAMPANAPCRTLVMRQSEKEIAWKLQCDPKLGDFNGKGLMKFNGDTVEGLVETVSSYPQPMQVTQHISGKRVGECKKSPLPPNTTPLPAPERPPGSQLPAYRP